MICFARRNCSRWRTAVTTLAIAVAASPVNSEDWLIETPAANEMFDVGATISGNGTGLAEATFTIKVKWGFVTKNTKQSGVSPEGNWEDGIAPPAPNGVWKNAAGQHPFTYEIWKDGDMLGQVLIVINQDP